MRVIKQRQPSGLLRRLRRDRSGSTLLLATLLIPVIVDFGGLAIESAYLYYRNIQLRQTDNAAALAGASQLVTYYTSGTGSAAAVTAAVQTIAAANAPNKQFGRVVPASNVVVGNWNATTSTFTSLAASGRSSPNAVQVTGLSTKTNGNSIPVFFAGRLGMSSVDLTKTAVASFGTGQNFDTIILNDLSQSFSSDISEQRAADLAILNCIKTTSNSKLVFGVTTFDGHSSIYVPLTQATSNTTSLTANINALNYCGTSGMPACSGSNVAAGLYSAIQQFSSVSSTNTIKNIILITDGVPNVSAGVVYTTAVGIYPTPSSKTPVCTVLCTDANLLTMAQNQATDAAAASIEISTIYYAGSTATGSQASYTASLASLRRGTGVSLVAPTSAKIASVFGGFCATMTSATVALN
jgi:Flp pilus assembly protein TadG